MKKLILTIALSISFSFACDGIKTERNYKLGCPVPEMKGLPYKQFDDGFYYMDNARDIGIKTNNGIITSLIPKYPNFSYTEFMSLAEKLAMEYGEPVINGDMFAYLNRDYSVVLTRKGKDVFIVYALRDK